LIHVGYESGCRAGELLALRLKDVELDRYGAVIVVRGKTGKRRIRLVESVPDLQLWLRMHPRKGDSGAPLWPSRADGSRAMTVGRFNHLLRCTARKAGLRKRVYPHLLRHSRATHLAKVLTEAQLREYFGWTRASDIPARYVHLSGRDVDRTLLRHYGIERADESSAGETSPKECPRCGALNQFDASFCMRCSMPLDARVAVRSDGLREEAERAVARFIEHVRTRDPKLATEAAERSGILGVWRQLLALESAGGSK
jgi:ribosomal protein L40E